MSQNLNWAEIASMILEIVGAASLFAAVAYGFFRYAASRDAEREQKGETVVRSLAGYAPRRG